MIKVVIVDDHEIVRRGFGEMLQNESNIDVVHEAGSSQQLNNFLQVSTCDVVLLDISLPDESGVDILRQLRQRYETVKVLVLSGFPEERYALPMMKNGASGYLCKNCEQEELIKAIKTVAAGRKFVSEKTAELFAEEMTGEREDEPHKQLSERELQVFLRLAEGETVSNIAETLFLSSKTISTYRARILEKMLLSSNAELAAYAVRHGLVGEEMG